MTKKAAKKCLIKKCSIGEFLRNRIPEVLVILLCLVFLGIGVAQKEGFHMDELLSFELSNAEFTPWIVPTQPEGRLAKFVHNEIDGDTFGETVHNLFDTVIDVLQNRGNSKMLSYKADVFAEPTWITAEQFTDYITVGSDDAFNYLSVYFNVKDDNHPPLHFMLLHTMSSIFQGKAESWMGCFINMVCVAACMVLLMCLGNMLAPVFGLEDKGRLLGILAALLYGISTGAMATTLLIRMYGLVTCFCVALLYVHVKKWMQDGFGKKNKTLIIVTMLGFWTQYFFLFYCLILAAVTAALLLYSKRIKDFWHYVRSMVFAAVIGVGVFPFAISDVFSSGRGVEALDNLASGFDGYGTRLATFASILVNRTFGKTMWVILLLLAIVMVGLLLYGRGQRKIAHAEGANQENMTEKQQDAEKGDKRMLLCMLVIPVAGYFLLASRMAPYLVDRYIMPLFPFVILLVALFLVEVAQYLEKENSGKRIVYTLCGAVVLMQLWELVQYDGSYQYRNYDEQEAIAREYSDHACICVYDGVGYYENLPEFTHYKKTLLVTETELAERTETDTVTTLEEVVVLVKPSVDLGDVSQVLSEKYNLTYGKLLYDIREYGDGVHLFVKEQK